MFIQQLIINVDWIKVLNIIFSRLEIGLIIIQLAVISLLIISSIYRETFIDWS